MTFIKAPYNFVPVSSTVVFPEWRNAVSHDIPFQDGESGTITVKIKAESPIFVKQGMSKDEEKSYKNDIGIQIKPYPFSKSKNGYFIPGSSIRGSIRNVLEILTFSKMEKVDDTRYSVRDLSPAANHIYLGNFKIDDISCGWLRKESEDIYTLQDCGTPGRISQEELDDNFHKHFQKSNMFDRHSNLVGWNNKDDYHKSAKYKYDKYEQLAIQNTFDFQTNDCGRHLYNFGSEKQGIVVFTGQPDHNDCKMVKDKKGEEKKRCGKHFEFIFFNTSNETEPVPEQVMKNFFFAYYDHDKNSQSDDWKERKKQLDKGDRIPVFFRRDGKEIKDMGLSFLYKITYENSVKDLLSADHKKHEPDFAETIFGFINDNTKQALKGRVHFEHAFNTNNAELEKLQKEALSGPKASYYPNYIRQNVDKNGKVIGNYQTFMDENAQLSGWKRYPVHKGKGVEKNPGTDNVATHFTPLKAGAEFELKIRLHNMRKVEIGALLSAITFHNTPNTYHGIGMAKPLGYGKTKLEITNISGFENLTLQNKTDYMKAFEAYMRANVDWENQAKEVIDMSSEQNNAGNSELAYMKMDPEKRINDFVNAKNDKNNKEALQEYSKLDGVQHNSVFRLLANENDILEFRKKQNTEKEIYQSKSVEELFKNALKNSENNFSQICSNKKNSLLCEIESKLLSFQSDFESNVNLMQIQNQKEMLAKQDAQRKAGKAEAASSGLRAFCQVENKTEFKKFKDFNAVLNRYKSFAQKIELNDKDKDFFIQIITNIYTSSAKFEQKQFEKEYIKTISSWLSPETARLWFTEISKE